MGRSMSFATGRVLGTLVRPHAGHDDMNLCTQVCMFGHQYLLLCKVLRCPLAGMVWAQVTSLALVPGGIQVIPRGQAMGTHHRDFLEISVSMSQMMALSMYDGVEWVLCMVPQLGAGDTESRLLYFWNHCGKTG